MAGEALARSDVPKYWFRRWSKSICCCYRCRNGEGKSVLLSPLSVSLEVIPFIAPRSPAECSISPIGLLSVRRRVVRWISLARLAADRLLQGERVAAAGPKEG